MSMSISLNSSLVYWNGPAGNSKALYKGKWSRQEEEYLVYLVKDFKEGALDIKEGTSLRAYLAAMLGCNPKRISKKMECTDYYGRGVYIDQKEALGAKEVEERRENLKDLREKFLASREELVQQEAAKMAAKTYPAPSLALPVAPRVSKFSSALQNQSAAVPNPIPTAFAAPPALEQNPRMGLGFNNDLSLAMMMLMAQPKIGTSSSRLPATSAFHPASPSLGTSLDALRSYSRAGETGHGGLATSATSLLHTLAAAACTTNASDNASTTSTLSQGSTVSGSTTASPSLSEGEEY